MYKSHHSHCAVDVVASLVRCPAANTTIRRIRTPHQAYYNVELTGDLPSYRLAELREVMVFFVCIRSVFGDGLRMRMRFIPNTERGRHCFPSFCVLRQKRLRSRRHGNTRKHIHAQKHTFIGSLSLSISLCEPFATCS